VYVVLPFYVDTNVRRVCVVDGNVLCFVSFQHSENFTSCFCLKARGSIVVKALMLQTGKSRVPFPIECFFFNLPNLSGSTRHWYLLSL
jgi:hypothetical protein